MWGGWVSEGFSGLYKGGDSGGRWYVFACLHFLWWFRNCGECEGVLFVVSLPPIGQGRSLGLLEEDLYLTVKPLLQVACTFWSCEVVPTYTKRPCFAWIDDGLTFYIIA